MRLNPMALPRWQANLANERSQDLGSKGLQIGLQIVDD